MLPRYCEKCGIETYLKPVAMVRQGWCNVIIAGQEVWKCPSCVGVRTAFLGKRRRFIPPEDPPRHET